MRLSGRAWAGAAVLLMAGVLFSPTGLAATASVPVVGDLQWGYWWVAESSDGALPPPPSVPAHGLWVSSNPSGPQAVSAIRFDIPAGASAPVVTLEVHDESPPGSAQIVACTVLSAWKAPSGAGAWSERPIAGCGTISVAGKPTPDGNGLQFDLAPFVEGRSVDVTFQPASASPSAVGSPALPPTFDATFEALTPSMIAVTDFPTAANSSASPGRGPPIPPDGTSGSQPYSAAPASPEVQQAGQISGAPQMASSGQRAPGLGDGAPTAGPASRPPLAPSRSASVSFRSVVVRSWRDKILLALMLVDLVGYWAIQSWRSSPRIPRMSIYDLPDPSSRRILVGEKRGSPSVQPPVRMSSLRSR